MIQQNEADLPEMVTEPGKWLDGDTRYYLTELLRHDNKTDFTLCPKNEQRYGAVGGIMP